MTQRAGESRAGARVRMGQALRVAASVVGCAALCILHSGIAQAQETVCARVKIEIKQELTLERQAFDAEMNINNTTDNGVISNVSIVVKVYDEQGTPVEASSDPNSSTAKFFVRVSGKQNISDIDGNGTVNPATTSTINWLIIPAPGSAGTSPLGKKYLIGATLKYTFGGEDQTLDVSPDVITVKPLPLLTLDYFLTKDVWADDPLTAEIEPVEPFTLGVRVKNNGFATAKNLKIDSAQPKIVENNQGLLIGFKLDGSYVNDAPADNTLLINFGDVAANTSKMGRWIMETTLAGKFTEFTASFTHADELGGSLTSILQAANAHLLIRDVRVDLPGRDYVRDFLAQDGDVIRVYESDAPDTLVTDRSSVAALTASTSIDGKATYHLIVPPTDGFLYVKLPDPFNGTKALGVTKRSDAKTLLPENVWLSKTRNSETKKWEYWVNFFDVNSTGVYDAEFEAPPAISLPPQIQFIPDRVTQEEHQVSFLVEASSPGGAPVFLSAAPLPAGAKFTTQATDPTAPTLTRAVFDWTPPKGTAGNYLVVYTATDGTLTSTRSASIKVESISPPAGPEIPSIISPASGAQLTSLKPTLSVQTSTNTQDPTVKVQFEIYKDASMTQLVDSALVDKAVSGTTAVPTAWPLTATLMDNTTYWWRARTYDGNTTYSAWINARFFVNLYNDPPDSFNLSLPVPDGEVADLQPTLAWSNAVDKDGDSITYGVRIFDDAALTHIVVQTDGLLPDVSGTTSWQVNAALIARKKYYWRVIATDVNGAQTMSAVRDFFTGVGNSAPTTPTLVSPALDARVANLSPDLTVGNSTDADGDLLTYIFELDTVPSFDSGAKRASSEVLQGLGATTSWHVSGLIENKHYFWRAKAQDGRSESAWVQGTFLVDVINEAPAQPTVHNPGNGAWVSTLTPVLEANPALDPEGDTVHYEFQLAKDAGFATVLQSGVSALTTWTVPSPLDDKSTYWWSVRAVDASGAASSWSPASVMYVSTGTYQNPSIQLLTPSSTVVPTQVGASKIVHLTWQGTDLNIEPTVALYYASNKTAFTGTLIVDGLRQSSGVQSASYDWNVSTLAPGAYYVYAVIYDSRGLGQAWAAGAVVIPAAAQTGSVVETITATPLQTTEVGGQAQFKIKLGSAPTDNVVLPVASTMSKEGVASPPSLTFTPANWNVDQTVTVTGQADCIPDGTKQYQVLVGQAVSLDPQYIGISGAPVAMSNSDAATGVVTSTNSPNIRICGLTIKTEVQINPMIWEYTVETSFGNSGNPVTGGTAKLTSAPSLVVITDPDLQFGALQYGETGRSLDTITVRSNLRLTPSFFAAAVGFKWSITVN
ncbi:MAG: fliK [Rhodocyclales bacterium]|nr:fliK [Rhodocyclales bacterium]